MEHVCCRAVECANILRQQQTGDLKAHIAVTCGQFRFATLGGFNSEFVYVVNGQCLSEISGCLQSAGSQEVVISEAVYDCISAVPGRDKVEVVQVRAGSDASYRIVYAEAQPSPPSGPGVLTHSESRFASLPANTELNEMVKLFVPKPVKDAVASSAFSVMAELREVTTVFLKLDSYDTETHRNPLSLQPFFLMAQKVIVSNGGYLRQFLIDDKGCVLIVLFGVRTYSHTNTKIERWPQQLEYIIIAQLLVIIVQLVLPPVMCFVVMSVEHNVGTLLR